MKCSVLYGAKVEDSIRRILYIFNHAAQSWRGVARRGAVVVLRLAAHAARERARYTNGKFRAYQIKRASDEDTYS